MSHVVVDTTPINLRERIAALQQRASTPVQPATPPTTKATPPSPGAGNLRDKIAKFERKGGVPLPRGSLGLGASPVADAANTKQKVELYGNRISSVGLGGSHGRSYSLSLADSLERKRFASVSGIATEGERSSVDLSVITSSFVSEPESNLDSLPTDFVGSPSENTHSANAVSDDSLPVTNDAVVHRRSSLEGRLPSHPATSSGESASPPFAKHTQDSEVVSNGSFTKMPCQSLETKDRLAASDKREAELSGAAQYSAVEVPISRKSSSNLLRPRISVNSLLVKEEQESRVAEINSQKANSCSEPPSVDENSSYNISVTMTAADALTNDRPSKIPRIRVPPSPKAEPTIVLPPVRNANQALSKPEVQISVSSSYSSQSSAQDRTKEAFTNSTRQNMLLPSGNDKVIADAIPSNGKKLHSDDVSRSRVPIRVQTTSFLDSEPSLDLSLLVAQAAQLEQRLSHGEGTGHRMTLQPTQPKSIISRSFDDLTHSRARVEKMASARPIPNHTVHSVVSAPGKKSNIPVPTSPNSTLSWRNAFNVPSFTRARRAKTSDSTRSRTRFSDKSSDDYAPAVTPPSPFELINPPLLYAESNSSTSSLWSSPKRTAKRALSRSSMFMNRMFSRAGRSNSSLALPDDTSIYSNRSHSPISAFTPLSLTPIIHSPSLSPRLSMLSEDIPSVFSPTFEKDIFEGISASNLTE